jgi:uncharacterized protein
VSAVHELTRADARRVAIAAQLLDEPRPDDVLEVVRHLTVLQPDPTSSIAPSADLVLWSRIGSSYDPAELADAVDSQVLIEHGGMLRPAENIALYRAEMAQWPGSGELRPWQIENREWVETNNECRLDILERLRGDGPLPASELPDSCVVPWRSSGWNNDRNVRMLLQLMVARGEVAAAGRAGREKLWDLAERVYPDDPVPDADEALRLRNDKWLHALGIARAKAAKTPGEPNHVGEAGEPAVIEGVKGQWRVDPHWLDRPFTGRAALLSPFDRLVQDRKRTTELFDYEYYLEMFKPADQRRWGYYALPILYRDQLVGKLDATADSAAGALFVDTIHEGEPFTDAMTTAVDREIEDLARWLRLQVVRT